MKVGIFGGTFDPPHLGHAIAATESKIELELDKVFFVPAYQNRLKENAPSVSIHNRIAMTKLLVEHIDSAKKPSLEVSRFEERMGRITPTIEVIRHFSLEMSIDRNDLFLILGIDNLHRINEWIDSDKYKHYCQTVFVHRGEPGKEEANAQDYKGLFTGHNVHFIKDTITTNISSTEIRNRIKLGLEYKHLVPPSVEAYIRVCNLYK